MADKVFIDGMLFKLPRESAPDFVRGSLSVKVDEFSEWFAKWQEANPQEAWINIDLCVGRSGKPYAALNTYKKLGMTEKPEVLKTIDWPKDDINPDDIPF